jgi:hypothetical protein
MMASGGPGPQTIIAFDIGFWFALKDQRLRRIDVGPADRLSVDKTVQKVQHMGLGRDTFSQGHFHGDQHSLFVVMQNQRQDVDHLPVTAGATQHEILQLLEGWREFGKGGTIPQGTG